MSIKSQELFVIVLLTAALVLGSAECKAADAHRLYLGTAWSHMSNVDAGKPFNNLREDSADHVGIDIEYQYHRKDYYLFGSFGVGKSRISTKYQLGWDCSGCKLPSMVRVGFKYRIN